MGTNNRNASQTGIPSVLNSSYANVIDNSITIDDTVTYNKQDSCLYIDPNDLYSTSLKDAFDLSIVHLNCRSLIKNHDAVSDLLYSLTHCSFTIAAVTETWLHDSISASLIDIPNYTFIRNDRLDKRGGGVGFYIKHGFCYSVRSDLSNISPHFESLFIEVKNCKDTVVIGTIYRPPANSIPSFNEDLSKLLTLINTENKTCYLVGDFNIDLIQYGENRHVNDFLDLLYSSSFLPRISKPTRITDNSSTLIDNIFCNNHNVQLTSGIIVCDISDHLPIYAIQHSFNPRFSTPDNDFFL